MARKLSVKEMIYFVSSFFHTKLVCMENGVYYLDNGDFCTIKKCGNSTKIYVHKPYPRKRNDPKVSFNFLPESLLDFEFKSPIKGTFYTRRLPNGKYGFWSMSPNGYKNPTSTTSLYGSMKEFFEWRFQNQL